MKTITAAITVLAFILALNASAEENGKTGPSHFIGVNISSISGGGLSYGYSFIPEYMFKINGIYIISTNRTTDPADPSEHDYATDINWNAGAEVQRDVFSFISDNITTTGYVLAGGSYWYSMTDDPYDPAQDDTSKRWAAGVALGVRFIFYDHISLNVEAGYQYGRDIDDGERYAGFGGGIGAHFAF